MRYVKGRKKPVVGDQRIGKRRGSVDGINSSLEVRSCARKKGIGVQELEILKTLDLIEYLHAKWISKSSLHA